MEEILRKLQRDASGSKHKAIKESCTWALGKRGRCAGTPAPRITTGSTRPLGGRDCHPVWVMDARRAIARVASENMQDMKILGIQLSPFWSPYLLPNLKWEPLRLVGGVPLLGPQHRWTQVPHGQVRIPSLHEIRALVPRRLEGRRGLIKATALFSNVRS